MALKKPMILVVDDNEIILRTLTLKLEMNHYDVVTATDGSEALGIVRLKRPDLILLDISFPPDVAHGGGVAWDGFLIIAWFKRMEEAKNVPIIIMTAGEESKYKQRALAAGAAGFFHKPINNDELLATIKTLLGESPKTTSPSA